jgi:hypothetical protein
MAVTYLGSLGGSQIDFFAANFAHVNQPLVLLSFKFLLKRKTFAANEANFSIYIKQCLHYGENRSELALFIKKIFLFFKTH